MSGVSAVVFARDHRILAAFYRDALGLLCTASGEEHTVLNCRGFDLVVQQIPTRLLADAGASSSPQRRERNPIRLDFPVDSLDQVRSSAAKLGGHVDESPPAWAPKDANFRLGHDPEGNVFRIVQRSG